MRSSRRAVTFGPVTAGLMVLSAVLAARCAAGRNNRPSEVLAQAKGLTQIGHIWICPTEALLRKHLAGLPKFESKILAAQRRRAEIVEQNNFYWNKRREAESTVRQLEQARKQAAAGSSQRERLTRQWKQQQELLKALKQKAVNPADLGESPAVRALLIALTNDRNRLALAILSIRVEAPQLPAEYRRLERDPQLTDALENLGPEHRLGPAKDYRSELEGLARYEALVFTSSVPLYRECGRFRVGAILNEQTPVTFTWQSGGDPAFLTANAIQAAGLTVPAAAPSVQHTFGRGRRLTVRRLNIPCLRLGGYVFRNVAAFALPPQGEDLGSQIGPTSLTDYSVAAEPEQLRLVIRPVR